MSTKTTKINQCTSKYEETINKKQNPPYRANLYDGFFTFCGPSFTQKAPNVAPSGAFSSRKGFRVNEGQELFKKPTNLSEQTSHPRFAIQVMLQPATAPSLPALTLPGTAHASARPLAVFQRSPSPLRRHKPPRAQHTQPFTAGSNGHPHQLGPLPERTPAAPAASSQHADCIRTPDSARESMRFLGPCFTSFGK